MCHSPLFRGCLVPPHSAFRYLNQCGVSNQNPSIHLSLDEALKKLAQIFDGRVFIWGLHFFFFWLRSGYVFGHEGRFYAVCDAGSCVYSSAVCKNDRMSLRNFIILSFERFLANLNWWLPSPRKRKRVNELVIISNLESFDCTSLRLERLLGIVNTFSGT